MLLRTRVSGSMFSRFSCSEDEDRLTVQIRGHNMDIAAQIAETIREIMTRIPGIAEPTVRPETRHARDACRSGSPASRESGAECLRRCRDSRDGDRGTRSSMYRKEGDEFNILVRLREEDRLDLRNVGRIPADDPAGRTIPAESVIELNRQKVRPISAASIRSVRCS